MLTDKKIENWRFIPTYTLLKESIWTVDSPYMTLDTGNKNKVYGTISKASWDAMSLKDVITVRVTLQDKFVEAKVYKKTLESISISPSMVNARADQQMTFTFVRKNE